MFKNEGEVLDFSLLQSTCITEYERDKCNQFLFCFYFQYPFSHTLLFTPYFIIYNVLSQPGYLVYPKKSMVIVKHRGYSSFFCQSFSGSAWFRGYRVPGVESPGYTVSGLQGTKFLTIRQRVALLEWTSNYCHQVSNHFNGWLTS